MDLRAVWILYRRELRSALRERSIVVNSILMPIFLYPVLLWVMFSAVTFVQGLREGFTARVAFTTPVPAGHGELLDSLRTADGVTILGAGGEEAVGDGGAAGLGGTPGSDGEAAGQWESLDVPVLPESQALALLQAGDADAILSFREPTEDAAALPGNFRLQVRYDRAERRSGQAESRVTSVVEDYRDRWVVREAEALGIGVAERTPFAIASENISTSRDLGAMVLGQMLSFFIIIMVALGCFVPSVDTTAGERERNTWETLMTVAASRSSMVTAKYLYVATLGITAGLLNVVALFLSIGAVVRPLLENAGEAITFSIPPLAIPVMMAGAVALALFFAAAMMILAAFARSFKDGQAMVQPVYWLVFLPLLLGQQTDRTLTPAIASIPVANVSMMIRDAMNGVFLWPLIAQTLLVTLATVVLCLWAARYILRFEDFLLGSFDGSFWRFVKDRFGGGRGSEAAR